MNDARQKTDYVRITEEDRRHHEEVVGEEARSGRLADWVSCQRPELRGKPIEKQKLERVRDIESDLRWAREVGYQMRVTEEATRQLRIPGEPDVFDALLSAQTTEQVKEICRDALTEVTREIHGVERKLTVPNWPISSGSVLPMYLSQYAAEFLAAKTHPKYPRSATRPTTRLKQIWFLSRVLAGALYGVRARTAVNLVGSKRPEQVFNESRSSKSTRKHRGRKQK
jgi:hypothetical protein